jgi:5'-methylthioinosine phosphorylase
VIGVNAVGGIRADMGPRVIVVPDQLIDYTHGRYTSFCDVEGAEVKHIDFSEPYTESLRQHCWRGPRAEVPAVHRRRLLRRTQGPRLETRAEIARMKRDGCDLVGMTGMPEAVWRVSWNWNYACLALVANFAAGCGDEAEISIEEIFAHLAAATAQVPPILADARLSNQSALGRYPAQSHIALYLKHADTFSVRRGGGPGGGWFSQRLGASSP